MNVEITHWGIPGYGADLDAPYQSPDCVLVPLVGVVWGVGSAST
jgi:hypothetical protein